MSKDKNPIKEARLSILRGCDKKYLVTKGTEHNINDIRVCSVCGRQLSRYIINDPDRMFSYIMCIADHYFVRKGQARFYVCKNLKDCEKELIAD